MLTVIGAGFPRTGTSSMKAALERLGFGPCHHMFDIMTDPARVDRWLPLADGEDVDWDHVLAGFRSTQDWPASHWWREQAEAYPEAKVVLTVRDPGDWHASMQTLITSGPARFLPEDAPEDGATLLHGMLRLRPVLGRISASVFGGEQIFREGMPDVAESVAVFERHVAEVRESLPPDRLLVFDVREGWEPLCRFLEADVPDEPFPHLNDAASLRATLDRLWRLGSFDSPSFLPPGSGAQPPR
ncbi:sulfotransferase family protein [Actinomadura sp. ATCC 31491]|uniref:Sulfotransferase family protein n=1 Tax=Actinomadura luzonensis TaxID=2805427 RepID=A0ABT0G389_9ACTN|nr:sulfotransferase family protein [Actinomadura luzonensis]MCK2219080.1 sulfotransferase family protein [Actinomadura luzonensis]